MSDFILKPREWWVNERPYSERYARGDTSRYTAWGIPKPGYRTVHVIEKKAYDKLKFALEQILNNFGKPESGCHECGGKAAAEIAERALLGLT